MPNHDFSSLNDQDFESLSCDLLSEVEGRRFERFKRGRDGGVDGRYFSLSGGEIVLQCKHWAKSGVSALITSLKSIELDKIKKIKPIRYLICTSLELSREDKEKIRKALSPFVLRADDIYGLEDLNDLLGKYPAIERRHYKLWLKSAETLSIIISSAIMGRSSFTLSEIHSKAERYVRTRSHDHAVEKLKSSNVVLITGAPGVGKTTLAEQLCLESVLSGYQICVAAHNIEELEAVYSEDERQIFYFDDFLGRNFLEALGRHEDSRIVGFMRRVQNDATKRFVLTSRSTVLARGKQLTDLFSIEKINHHEFEVKVEHLSGLDKAKILHSCIWYSSLSVACIEEVVVGKAYKKIINHRNFNPRLISFVTDPDRLISVPVGGYMEYVLRTLNDPEDVWASVFDRHIQDAGRSIVSIVAMSGGDLSEVELRAAYSRFIAMTVSMRFVGDFDFDRNMPSLIGSILNRYMIDEIVSYRLFNPSVGDFVLRRVSKDIDLFSSVFRSLRTVKSVKYMDDISREKIVKPHVVGEVLRSLLLDVIEGEVDASNVDYVCALVGRLGATDSISMVTLSLVVKAAEDMYDKGHISACLSSFARPLSECLKNDLVSADVIVKYLEFMPLEDVGLNADDLIDVSGLICALPDVISEKYQEDLCDLICDEMCECINEDVISAGVLNSYYDESDLSDAESELGEYITERLKNYSVKLNFIDEFRIANHVDMQDIVYKNIKRSMTEYQDERVESWIIPETEIDELFKFDLPPAS